MRLREDEWRDLDIKLLLTIIDHLVGTLHRAERHRQRAARGVLKALARSQDGLIPDDALTSDLLHLSHRVGDPPMATDQLHGVRSFIGDADRVEKEPLVLLWAGAAGIVLGFDLYADAFCCGFGG